LKLSPLEQFQIIPFNIKFYKFFGFSLDFTVSNFSIMLCLIFLFIIVLVKLIVESGIFFVANRLQFLFQNLIKFVIDILYQQTQNFGLVFFRFFFILFFFILLANLIGLVPFCFTVTSHLILVLFIALASNLTFLFLGIARIGFKDFLKHFIPQAAPKLLIPLITLIEVVSYLIRTLSLSLRLFANMVAGHILLFILASFALKFVALESYVLVYFPILVMLLVFILEFAICFIQAYVFLILLSIYSAESLIVGASH
jgi:F-type H+-transporting ATPase subunit a